MLSNFHKTTSEHWQRTPGMQKGSPFSSIVRRENIQRERENSENIQSIIYLTFLGRRFREGLGILSFVEFDPLNELLVTYHS